MHELRVLDALIASSGNEMRVLDTFQAVVPVDLWIKLWITLLISLSSLEKSRSSDWIVPKARSLKNFSVPRTRSSQNCAPKTRNTSIKMYLELAVEPYQLLIRWKMLVSMTRNTEAFCSRTGCT